MRSDLVSASLSYQAGINDLTDRTAKSWVLTNRFNGDTTIEHAGLDFPLC